MSIINPFTIEILRIVVNDCIVRRTDSAHSFGTLDMSLEIQVQLVRVTDLGTVSTG